MVNYWDLHWLDSVAIVIWRAAVRSNELCASSDDSGYVDGACFPNLWMAIIPESVGNSESDTPMVSITFFKQMSKLHWYSNSDTGLSSHVYKASSRILWNTPGFPNFGTIDILSQIIFSWGGENYPVHCNLFRGHPWPLSALDANSPAPSCDNQKCLLALLNVPWGGGGTRSSLIDSHWNRQTQQ